MNAGTSSENSNNMNIDRLTCPADPPSVKPETIRQVKIQKGVLSRLMKEHSFYVQDAEKILKQIEDMKAKGSCPHDINKVSEVFVETKKMVPQTLSEVGRARNKLSKLLEGLTPETSPIFAESEALLLKANLVLGPVSGSEQPVDQEDERVLSSPRLKEVGNENREIEERLRKYRQLLKSMSCSSDFLSSKSNSRSKSSTVMRRSKKIVGAACPSACRAKSMSRKQKVQMPHLEVSGFSLFRNETSRKSIMMNSNSKSSSRTSSSSARSLPKLIETTVKKKAPVLATPVARHKSEHFQELSPLFIDEQEEGEELNTVNSLLRQVLLDQRF